VEDGSVQENPADDQLHDEAPKSPKKETPSDDEIAHSPNKNHSPQRKKKKKKKTSPTSSPSNSPKKRKSVKKHKKKHGAHVEEESSGANVDTAKGELALPNLKEKSIGTSSIAEKKAENDSVPPAVSEQKSASVFEIQPSNFILESEKALASRPPRKIRKPTTSSNAERTLAAEISSPTYESSVPPPSSLNSYSLLHGSRSGIGCGLPHGIPAGI